MNERICGNENLYPANWSLVEWLLPRKIKYSKENVGKIPNRESFSKGKKVLTKSKIKTLNCKISYSTHFAWDILSEKN